jgi:hypothetical protein
MYATDTQALEVEQLRLVDKPEGDGFASMSYLSPEGGASSYQIVGALAITLKAFQIGEASVWNWRIAPGLVKNTLISQEQNTRYVEGALVGSYNRLGSETTWIPALAIRFDNDLVADITKLRFRTDTELVNERLKIGGYQPLTGGWSILWGPRAGLYYERDTSNPSGNQSVAGVFARVEASLMPPGWFEDTSINAAYQIRHDLTTNAPYEEHTTTLRKVGASYYFVDPQVEKGFKPRLSYEWAKGADPFLNQPKQSYNQLLFELRYER